MAFYRLYIPWLVAYLQFYQIIFYVISSDVRCNLLAMMSYDNSVIAIKRITITGNHCFICKGQVTVITYSPANGLHRIGNSYELP